MTDRIAKLKALLETEPDDTFCLYGLAQEHAKCGDVVEAIACYDRVIDIDPDYFYAYFHKARSQQQLDDEPGAIETARTGLLRARAAGDEKAAHELAALIDELT